MDVWNLNFILGFIEGSIILQEEDSEGDLERSHSFLILSKDDMSMVSEKKTHFFIYTDLESPCVPIIR